MSDLFVTINEIQDAADRLAGHLDVTPLERSPIFSEMLGNRIYHKLENLQATGSFKVRGALNAMLCLSKEERSNGVVAASAGNHAQGVAYAAQVTSTQATLVMPESTPLIKIVNVQRMGAEIVQIGQTYDDAAKAAVEIAREKGARLIHAFDDPAVIAGQGTVALEILKQLPDVDVVLVPIGGGGLISGVATALCESKKDIQIIGVQAEGSAAMAESLRAGSVIELASTDTFADGIRVASPSELTLRHVSRYVSQTVTVNDDELAGAVLNLMEVDKSMVEGAGAAPLAAMMADKVGLQGKNVVLLLSGGNIDVNLISRIIDRGLVASGRMVRIRVTLSDRPGQLSRLTHAVGKLGANILDVHHDRAFARARVSETVVEMALETRGTDHVKAVIEGVKEQGYEVSRT